MGVSPRTTNTSGRHVRTSFQSTESAPAAIPLEKQHEGSNSLPLHNIVEQWRLPTLFTVTSTVVGSKYSCL